MNLTTETILRLDKFKPRDYQLPLFDAVENKGYKKVLCLWCRRCLHPDTHIMMANGSFKLLKDIKEGDEILSWNGSAFEADRVKHIWKTEEKETIKLSAKLGPSIITSFDHVFAVSWKDRHVDWIKAQDIEGTRQFQLYPGIPCIGTHDPDMAEFLGYMCSDGYVSHYQQPKFTNTNIDILKRVEYLSFKLFGYKAIWREKGNGYDLGLTNGTRGGGYIPNAIKMLFRDYNMDMPKNIRPLHPLINTYDEESIGRFLAALISCDGSIFIHKGRDIYDKHRDRLSHVEPTIEITLSCGKSFAYGWGIYWLLRKLGIIPHQPIIERGSNFKVKIGRYEQIEKLLSYGPIYGKEDKQNACLELIADHNPTPQNIYNGCYRSGFKSSVPDKTTELYDIETEKNHNFVANGYLVHNSGKDLTAWNLVIRMAIQKVGIYFYCLPTFKQARLVIFDSMTNDGVRFIDYIPKELIKKINVQEMKITLFNDSIIQLIGSDTYDTSLVGTNPRCIVFSEYALADERAYQFIRPIMNANNGMVIFLSTPRGYNSFYTLYQIASHSKEWFCYKLTVEDCGHISLADIQKEINSGEMSEDLSQQEYYCSFSAGVEGSFYAKYIDRMKLKGQITEVPWEPGFQVHLAIDIGVRDSTSIIWFQCIGQTVRIIDCYQKNKEGLEHYVNIIKSKPYTYGRYIAPHDIAVKEWGSGQTRIAKAKELGIKFTLANNVGLMDGIESCRSAFAKIWIDEKNCSQLIKALENYRQEWDSKRKVYNERPLHDSNSHFCFVGETKIAMDKGELPIKDIKPGMFVKTPFGIRKVLEVHKRLTNELVDITINKTTLTCTPQHNIFTQHGMVKADALSYTDIVEHNGIIRRCVWRKIYGLYSRISDLRGFKTIFLSLKMNRKSVLMDTFLGFKETITGENQTHGQHCSAQSGCTIMAQYLKGFIFTISTAIRRTTYWTIYNVLTPKSTRESTVLGQIHGHNQKDVKSCCVNKIEKQQNGIEVQKGASGIENMRKIVYPFYKDHNINSNVSHAQKTSWVKWFGQNSVVILVKQNIERFSVKILKIAIVVFAKLYSRVVNTLLRRHVVKNVRVYQLAEQNEVYDLTIEHDNCYYANGYLVSNSDAFRYMCVSLSKTRDGLSAEELDKRYEAAMMGGSKMPRPFHEGPW